MNDSVREPIVHSGHLNTPVMAGPFAVPRQDNSVSAGSGMATGSDGKLVLRVLSGANQGAQVRMRAERMLVGNLESECDVILDVGSLQRHACLIRASVDGWSVLAIAGDLWLGQNKVELQQSVPIFATQVLTLGTTAFCLSDPEAVDWTTLQIPDILRKTLAGGHATHIGAASTAPASEPHWRLAKQITAILALLVLVALSVGGYFYLVPLPAPQPSPNTVNGQSITALRSVLRSQAWSQELAVQADPDHSDRVVISGYLAERGQAKQLEALLSQQGLSADYRWVSIAELSAELSRQLELTAGSELMHTKAGSFHMQTAYSAFAQYDRLVRRAMQDIPALTSFDIQIIDPRSSEENAPVVHYERAGSELAVTGLDAIRPEMHYQIQEIRRGTLPSVVMSDGARYFEGASLPGNAVLQKIGSDHVVVQTATQQLRIEFDTPAPKTKPAPDAKERAGKKPPAVLPDSS